MEPGTQGWLRVRGVGRERLARYLNEYLTSAGFTVEETTINPEGAVASLVKAHLTKANPAVPPSLADIGFRLDPTGGGAVILWEVPQALQHEADRSRALRFATELVTHLERLVATESRGTAKIMRDKALRLPFETGKPPA